MAVKMDFEQANRIAFQNNLASKPWAPHKNKNAVESRIVLFVFHPYSLPVLLRPGLGELHNSQVQVRLSLGPFPRVLSWG